MSRYSRQDPQVKNGLVTEEVSGWSGCNLEGMLGEVVERLKTEQQRYAVDYANLRLESVPKDYDDGYHIVLVGDRPATPTEIAAQLKRDNVQAAQRGEYRRQQYEQLKKEFGGP